MNKKKYLLDTSIIIDNPLLNISHLYQKGENEIYITEVVIEELEKNKESIKPEVKWAIRVFLRCLQEEDYIDVSEDIGKDGDSVFKVKLILEDTNEEVVLFIVNKNEYDKEILNGSGVNDAKIISVAKDYGLTPVSSDALFRFRAVVAGVKPEALKWDTVEDPTKLDLAVEYEVIEEQKEERFAILEKELKKWSQVTIHYINEEGFKTNKRDYLLFNGTNLEPIKTEKNDFKDNLVKPINMEQKFYAEMLERNFNIFVVSGSTGSGKTLLALIEGMKKVKSEKSPINGIVYMRYTVNAEDKFSSLGFRKGDEDTKLGYFSYPLYGALNFIAEQKMIKKGVNKDDLKSERNSVVKNSLTEDMIAEYNIEIMDIAHARGITITNKYIIFDEVQNAPNSILRLIGTRVGKNSKIIFMGDSEQVDHPFLSTKRNGLLTMLSKAYDKNEEVSEMVATIQLKETVRSDIAHWFQENLEG